MNKLKLTKQFADNDCGVACLAMLYNFYFKTNYSLWDFKQYLLPKNDGYSLKELINLGLILGLKLKPYHTNFQALNKIEIIDPVIILLKANNLNHFVVLYKKTAKWFYVLDPILGKVKLNHFQLKNQFIDVLMIGNKDTNFSYLKKTKNKLLISNFIKKEQLIIIFSFSCLFSILYLLLNLFIINVFSNKLVINNKFFFTLIYLSIIVILLISAKLSINFIVIFQTNKFKLKNKQIILTQTIKNSNWFKSLHPSKIIQKTKLFNEYLIQYPKIWSNLIFNISFNLFVLVLLNFNLEIILLSIIYGSLIYLTNQIIVTNFNQKNSSLLTLNDLIKIEEFNFYQEIINNYQNIQTQEKELNIKYQLEMKLLTELKLKNLIYYFEQLVNIFIIFSLLFLYLYILNQTIFLNIKLIFILPTIGITYFLNIKKIFFDIEKLTFFSNLKKELNYFFF